MKRFTLISLALLVIAHVSIAQDPPTNSYTIMSKSLYNQSSSQMLSHRSMSLSLGEMRDAIICSISRDSRYSTMKITPMPFRRVTNF